MERSLFSEDEYLLFQEKFFPFNAAYLNSNDIQILMHWAINNRLSNIKIYEKLFQWGYRVYRPDENQDHFMSMEFSTFDLFLLFVRYGANPNQVPPKEIPTLVDDDTIMKKKPSFFMTKIKPKFQKEYKDFIIQKILLPFIQGTKTKSPFRFLWKRIVDVRMASDQWNF